MDIMVHFSFTAARGMHRVCSGSVAGVSVRVLAWLSATVKGLRFGLIVVFAEDYTVRVEWKGAFITSVVRVTTVKTKSLF